MFDVDEGTFDAPQLPNHILLFVVNLALVLTSILFNSVVLFGAVKRQALKSDLTTVLLLEMLTVLDLLITLFSLLPVTISSLSGSWRLGTVLCVVNATLTRYLYHTELLLVSCISLHRLKLVLIRKGKRVGVVNKSNKLIFHKVALFLIAAVPVIPVLTTFLRPGKVSFVPSVMCCVTLTLDKAWGAVSFTFLAVPCVVVILSNMTILHKIFILRTRSKPAFQIGFFSGLKNAINPCTKQRNASQVRKINMSTYLTILTICLVFTISYGPLLVLAIRDQLTQPSPAWMGSLAIELLSLNVLANPVMYTLSNRRFRRYIANLVRCPFYFREDQREDSLVDGESSGDKVFNETVSKFFSDRRKSSLLTNSNRTNSILSSRTSLSSRWGSIVRESEVRVGPTSPGLNSRTNLGDLSRKISSNCSIMPDVKEHETMNFLTYQTSPTKQRLSVQYKETSKIHRQSAPSLRSHSLLGGNDKAKSKPTMKGSLSSSDVTKNKRSRSLNLSPIPIRRCEVSDITCGAQLPAFCSAKKRSKITEIRTPPPIIVSQNCTNDRSASIFSLCKGPNVLNDHIMENIL